MAVNAGQIKQYIEGINFPMNKEDLVIAVREKGAPEEVVSFIQNLPMEEVQSPGDIFRAINPVG